MRSIVALCLLCPTAALADDALCAKIATTQIPFQVTLQPKPPVNPNMPKLKPAELQIVRNGGVSTLYIGVQNGAGHIVMMKHVFKDGLMQSMHNNTPPMSVNMERTSDHDIGKDAIAKHENFQVSSTYKIEVLSNDKTNKVERHSHSTYQFVGEGSTEIAGCPFKTVSYSVESTQEAAPDKAAPEKSTPEKTTKATVEFVPELGMPLMLIRQTLSQAGSTSIETTFSPLDPDEKL